jgi:nucleotide-binding universal stress UspA family protein
MSRIDRVLAATDFSAPARHAAERAALIARDLGVALDLIHVTSISPVGRLRRLLEEAPADLEEQVLASGRHEMDRLAEMLRSAAGVSANTDDVTGELLHEINRHAVERGAGLLVLGARGASFMRHALLGSTAERLVRKSVIPLLVVKQPPHEPYRKVLVAVDFSTASLPALATARAVAPSAELVVLHAYEVPFLQRLRSAGVSKEILDHYRLIARRQALEGMQALLRTTGLAHGSVTTLTLEGDPSNLVVEHEQELDCDLVVVGKQGESMLEEALLGSVTKHVLQESQGDVLVSVRSTLLPDRAG